MKVNVLGTEYTIKESNKVDDMNLENADGYCDTSIKLIVINTFKDAPGSIKDLEGYRKEVIRHELIHAFLHESGLHGCSWGGNEEIVDWFALQFEKMVECFEKCKAL